MPRKKIEHGINEVEPLHIQAVTDHVTAAVEKILGDGREVFLSSALKPHKLSLLAQYGFSPVSRDDLDPKQLKELEKILPLKGPDTLLRYGDSIIVAASPEAVLKRARARAANNREQDRSIIEQYSDARLARQVGANVDSKWTDLPPETATKT